MKSVLEKVKKEPREASKIKAEALKEACPPSFDSGSLSVTFYKVEVRGGSLWLWLRASENGRGIPFQNPLIVVNPPIMVPDGTKKKVKDFFGKDNEVDNFKEDHLEALKKIVEHALKLCPR